MDVFESFVLRMCNFPQNSEQDSAILVGGYTFSIDLHTFKLIFGSLLNRVNVGYHRARAIFALWLYLLSIFTSMLHKHLILEKNGSVLSYIDHKETHTTSAEAAMI